MPPPSMDQQPSNGVFRHGIIIAQEGPLTKTPVYAHQDWQILRKLTFKTGDIIKLRFYLLVH
jgi:hypothetical protein